MGFHVICIGNADTSFYFKNISLVFIYGFIPSHIQIVNTWLSSIINCAIYEPTVGSLTTTIICYNSILTFSYKLKVKQVSSSSYETYKANFTRSGDI